MPRRVLYLAWAPFFSGAERALLLTLQHLDPDRYQPHVIVGHDGELAAQLRAARIPCEIRPLIWLDRRHFLRWARSVLGVLRSGARVRPALVHANDVPSFQPGGYAARVLRIPALTHVRFPDEESGFRWFLRPGFSRALFVSAYLRDDSLAKAPGLFGGRADVVHDGVRTPPPTTESHRLELRRALQLPERATVVGLTGQISEVKGIWEFVEAAALVTSDGAEACFAVLGDDLKGGGALRRAMEERVAAHDLSSRFRFLGFRPDAPSLIPAFDIVAVPSHIEPLGNATLEAMAAGRPVVGSRVGGIPEMVVEGDTGLLVPSRDAGALSGALRRLIADPDLRRRMGEAGRRRAISAFSLEGHAAVVQGIYDRVVPGRE